MVKVAVKLIGAYQRIISPFLSPRCRFYPSCSQYTVDAIQKHGLRRGLWMSLRRVVRCQPLHPGGYDPA
ncbi:MAG: membrane protein insertion efficiency factor YidD [bacterium]